MLRRSFALLMGAEPTTRLFDCAHDDGFAPRKSSHRNRNETKSLDQMPTR